MPQVPVTVNGRAYPVSCDAGQEARIERSAREVEGRVAGFVKQLGQVGDARLLLLAALVLADELAAARGAAAHATAAPMVDEEVLALGIERLAARIEAVAARLENP
jgi:cell division protein ZapA